MKILVVDDQVLIREALRGVLKELQKNAAVVEAPDSRRAIQCVEENPDLELIVLDLNLPDRSGFDLLAELRERYPAISVVVLSARNDHDDIARALDHGALGFIPKSAHREVMLSAFKLIFSGGIYVPAEILARPQPAAHARSPMRPLSAAELGLTARQMDVLALMMQGKSNKLICRTLDLAEPTVKNHVTAILKALKAANRTEAAIAAGALGLGQLRVRRVSETVPATGTATSQIEDGEESRISIAILPFTNMSDAPEQEYFADGLTEDLIMALGNLRHLHVTTRHTSFQYKNRASRAQQIGRELGVRYLVEGSVRRSINRVRVTAQLVDCDKGTHLWAGRYERELVDIFAVQDEIVRSISAQLAPSLVAAAVTTRRAAPVANLTAYDHFLRARSVWRWYKYIEGRDFLLKAVEADPSYAAALANLAYFYAEDIGMQESGESVTELTRLAHDYTARAIAANDGDPFAYWMTGCALIGLGRHREARHQLECALYLNPFDVNFSMDLGMIIGLEGRHEEGLAMVDRVFHLEPRLPPGVRAETFWIRCAMGDCEGAKADLQKTEKPRAYHHLSLAVCLAAAGQEEEAHTHVTAFEASRSPWFDVSGFTHWFCGLLALPSDRERFLRGVRTLGYKV